MFRPLHWAIIRSHIVSQRRLPCSIYITHIIQRNLVGWYGLCKYYTVVSSETQYETWWWPSAKAETCCLSNKYSTTLLDVFWLYYLHLLLANKFKCIDQGTKEDIKRGYWVNAAVAGQQLAKFSTRWWFCKLHIFIVMFIRGLEL